MEQKEGEGEGAMLYPIVKIEEVEEKINIRINKALNVERLNHMLKENKSLEDLLKGYERVRNSWGKADSIVKVIVVKCYCYNIVNVN